MKISGFDIISEISRGPVTTVYKAVQTDLDRPVILKTLNEQWNQDKELIQRFHREAKISARLKHENIVGIYNFGLYDGSFYIALEYLEGVTLKERLHEHGQHSQTEAEDIFFNVLSGLAYAHNKGVIHRDIKPANIIITPEGLAKITDFGMATIADIPTLTDHGSAVGTPAYMSPEQAMGMGLDERSDIYSLGITIYELITGKSPFLANNIATTINNTINHEPQTLVEAGFKVSESFSDLIKRMINKDPGKRPASVRVILSEYFTSAEHYPYEQNNFSAYRPSRKSISKKMYVGIPAIMSIILLYMVIEIPDGRQKMVENKTGHFQLTDTVTVAKSFTPAEESDLKPMESDEKENRISMQTAQVAARFKADSLKAPAADQELPGSLFVKANPWAEIYFNGQYVDTTPLRKPIILPAGEHVLQFRNPNYEQSTRTVHIIPGKNDTLSLNMVQQNGYVVIHAVPWARVYIDDKYAEITPILDHSLPAGRHFLRLENPEHPAIMDTIIVQAGEKTEKRFRFR